ncbi:broad-complex core protein-like isoform X8 [Macrobrachium nipponense]|uniref:broad-complex core protein-like isoform X8 n=1 Tax=Macrobrachium nipponense TaxID=159736 RepID=UPI0030C7B932
MGADQQFCLRWNNFHSNITSAFESLRDDEDFVDITLACDGRQIKAHKMVLSACSPYFRSLLKGNPCQHPIVFLKDVTFSNLSSILDFMYHGEVNVSHNELATFLKTAEALKVRGLAEDEKKKDSENYNESSSPPPPRDPPDPGSPRPEEGSSAPDTHLSDSPPPKRQRRRSGNSVHSTEDTNETVLSDQQVRDTSVKNEPQDFNEEEDILSQSVDQDVIKSDVVDDDRNFGPAESVTIRSQAAMQQLQESFGSFLPGMGQSPGFLPHGATDMPRPPPYPLEGVQGLPPGISALPGPSMSQGAASQDASQGVPAMAGPGGVGGAGGGGSGGCGNGNNGVSGGVGMAGPGCGLPIMMMPGGGAGGGGGGGGSGSGSERFPCRAPVTCPVCGRICSNKYILRTHMEDRHSGPQRLTCPHCAKEYSSRNSLLSHISRYHREREPGPVPLPTVELLEGKSPSHQGPPPPPPSSSSSASATSSAVIQTSSSSSSHPLGLSSSSVNVPSSSSHIDLVDHKPPHVLSYSHHHHHLQHHHHLLSQSQLPGPSSH